MSVIRARKRLSLIVKMKIIDDCKKEMPLKVISFIYGVYNK